MKGSSTILDPNQVNRKKLEIKIQKKNLLKGLNIREDILFKLILGKIISTIKLKINAMRPPNLFGIPLNIAYANKKYHSGIICIGVTRGFALIKFSASPK